MAPATAAHTSAPGISPSSAPSAARASAPMMPAAGALERHRARRARPHLRRASSAGTSCRPTPCRSRWRPCRCRPSSGRRRTRAARRRDTASRTAATAATAARPVLANALPPPRRPPRSSAMPSSDFCFRPRLRRHRRRQERQRRAAPSPASAEAGVDGHADGPAGRACPTGARSAARQPPSAATVLTTSAGTQVGRRPRPRCAAHAPAVTRLQSHSTAPADGRHGDVVVERDRHGLGQPRGDAPRARARRR